MTDRRGATPPRGGRGRKAPWIAPEAQTGVTRCPLCGSPNGAAAAFCRWCGTPLGRATDPVLGTTTRRALDARRGTPLGTVLGAVAGLALLGLLGVAAMQSGLLPGGDDASPSPRTAGSLSPSASPSGDVVSPSPGSGSPAPSPSGPAASPSQPAAPSPTASAAAPTIPPAATDFTCETASVGDASSSRWRLVRTRWGPRTGFDQLALVLALRNADGPRASIVTVESMLPSEVTERYGLPAPASGDRALVMSFEGPVQLPTPIDGDPSLTSIESIEVARDGNTTRAVIGVNGDGCHRLSAPGWEFAAAPQEVEVILDVNHE